MRVREMRVLGCQSVQVYPNDVLAGKYRVVRMLGEGGMGIVAEAVHLGLGHRVALKLLRSELVRPEHRERFFREARASGSLRSEHVVATKDVDTLPDGTPFLVMEYLEGSDLGRVVQQRGALAVREAADYVLQACHAVGEAHALGIVHRDLKPANLFLTHRPDGTPLVKVLDFGIAKVAGLEQARDLTATSQYMGSPSYMSPEQVRSAKRVDARTDLWALGVILYELLVGMPPFPGETTGDVFVRISTEPPRPFTPIQPAPGLESIILRCLQKDPDQRYRDVGELAAELAPFAGATGRARAEAVARIVGRTLPPVAAPATLIAPAVPITVTTLGQSAGQIQPGPVRRRRGAILAIAAVLVVAGAATSGYLMHRPGTETALPETAAGHPAAAPASPAASLPARSAKDSPGASTAPGAPPTPRPSPGAPPPPVEAASTAPGSSDVAPPGEPPRPAAATEASAPDAGTGTVDHRPPRNSRDPGRRSAAKPSAQDSDFMQDRK
jgi:tRNA A-37 threonylcarbamoyl transferase component Bud32